MFATHLPVDGLLWTTTDLLEATERVLADRPLPEQDAYLAGTARRIYLSQQHPMPRPAGKFAVHAAS